MDCYEPQTPRCQERIARVCKVNEGRDRIDRKSGRASPSELPVDGQLRTILTARFCGIETEDWDIVAEAAAKLQDLELAARAFMKREPDTR